MRNRVAGPAPPLDLSATVDLPSVVRSVPAARRVIAELLRAWSAERYCDDAVLLVSELVTNVIRHVHTGSSLVLHVDLTDPRLRISVADSSTVRPVPREPAAAAPGGHGLHMLTAIASRWGSEEHRGGKRVWFELGTAG